MCWSLCVATIWPAESGDVCNVKHTLSVVRDEGLTSWMRSGRCSNALRRSFFRLRRTIQISISALNQGESNMKRLSYRTMHAAKVSVVTG